jgi:hypothetical protein
MNANETTATEKAVIKEEKDVAKEVDRVAKEAVKEEKETVKEETKLIKKERKRVIKEERTLTKMTLPHYPSPGSETVINDPGHYKGYFCALCPGATHHVFVPSPNWKLISCVRQPGLGSHNCCSNCVVVLVELKYESATQTGKISCESTPSDALILLGKVIPGQPIIHVNQNVRTDPSGPVVLSDIEAHQLRLLHQHL